MRLAAIYLIEHYLFNTPQTISLINNYRYTIKTVDNKVFIEREKNVNYIKDFHSNNISELSAIVGSNGSGKTTILSIINKRNDNTKAIFIYEDKAEEIVIENRTGKIDSNGNFTEKGKFEVYCSKNKIESKVNIDVPVLYYSPIADQDLSKFESPISKTSHFKSTLSEYHLDNIERSIMLMTDELIDTLKSVYPEIPFFNFLSINAKPLYKRDLRNIYGGFKEEGDIESAQKRTLEILWEEYSNLEKEQLTHNSSSFFADIEVNIFSYLLIDATAIETAFNGAYEVPFKDFIKEPDFNKKLKHFFFNKIAHIDKYIYFCLKENMEDNNYHKLLHYINNTNFNLEIETKKELILSRINKLSLALNELTKKEYIILFQDTFKNILEKELIGAEYKYIRENLNSVSSHCILIFLKKKSELIKEIQKVLIEIKEKLPLEFNEILRVRNEILEQVKLSSKQAIKLFSAIQVFHSQLVVFTKQGGVFLEGGVIEIDLKKVEFKDFKKIIRAYNKVVIEFNSNSVISAQIIEFKPDKKLSYGEKSLLNLFSSLNEFTIRKNNYLRLKEHYILLLDEADLGFHPLWKKKFINAITKVLPLIFKNLNIDLDKNKFPELEERKIQIILTTHDPLTLSDIPNYNITYIKKGPNAVDSEISLVLNEREKPNKSFGANITDLLADSFFINDGLIGDFAKSKIQEVLDNLNFIILSREIEELKSNLKKNNEDLLNSKKEHIKNLEGEFLIREKEYLKKIIAIVDEPILRYKMDEMYTQAFAEEVDKDETIKRVKRILGNAGLNIEDLNQEI
jgi:ABC-type multidrug transport system ATPase subunit